MRLIFVKGIKRQDQIGCKEKEESEPCFSIKLWLQMPNNVTIIQLTTAMLKHVVKIQEG